MRRRMLTMPGIEQIIAFHTSDSDVMVVVAYADEATYDKIVNDPNGPFVKNAAELKLEELMEWKQSWRGTTMD